MKSLHVSCPSICVSRVSDVQQGIIPSNSNFNRQFLDLLKRIFVYDPVDRITAKEALQHPWFKEIANPDDGTEALKIRGMRDAEKAARDARERGRRPTDYQKQ